MYLRVKDCAKILYNLYEEIYNNNELVRVPTELDEQRIKKFAGYKVSHEEIWALANELVFVTDEPYLTRIDTIREKSINKRTFLLWVSIPAYRICVKPDQIIYNDALNEFAMESGFLNGVCNDLKEWFWFEGESIRIEDAEKIVQNIKDFFASRNC